MKRSGPLKPGKPLERRSRLAPISVKRRGQLAERARVRQDVHARDNYTCQAARLVPSVQCAGALDVHEVRRRSQDPAAWLNPALCLTVCRSHHEWAHAHPADAYEVGLLVRGGAL